MTQPDTRRSDAELDTDLRAVEMHLSAAVNLLDRMRDLDGWLASDTEDVLAAVRASRRQLAERDG
jgi:hypothetical protein